MKVIRCRRIGGKMRLSKAALAEVHEVVSSGGLVVYPTETVYGLGADPFDVAAVKRVFKVKRRPASMPISMAVPTPEALWFYGVFDEHVKEFCEKHMPGPITILLRATSLAPPSLLSKGRLLGLRVPDHPVAVQLLRMYSPLTATSANRHGHRPPTTCAEAVNQLGKDVDIYIDSGPCRYGQESTVVDLSGRETSIIRRGALSEQAL
jgi:L-threonylcarbamoyladenylate synthase